LARCLNALAYGYVQTRQFERSVACAMEAQKLYTSIGNLVLAADCQRAAGFGLTLLGRPHESLLTLTESLAFSQQIENLWGEAECTRSLAYTSLEVGDYGQAVRMGKQAIKQMRKVGTPFMKMSTQLTWGIIQRTMMAWDAATETLLLVLAEGREKDITFGIDWVLSELCAVYAAARDWERAYEYAKQNSQSCQKEPMLSLSLTGWHGIEALLRGGDNDLARADVELFARLVGENKRYQFVLCRSKAVLAQWDGDVAQAICHLENALALAQEMGLPGEEWPIWGELGRLYTEQGKDVKAKRAYGEAAVIILNLAETIDEVDLQAGFLAADPVRSVLEIGKKI
jgi:tetratricopeptide (TPR) repeat protein